MEGKVEPHRLVELHLNSGIGSRVLLVLYFREADILVILITYETEIFGFD